MSSGRLAISTASSRLSGARPASSSSSVGSYSPISARSRTAMGGPAERIEGRPAQELEERHHAQRTKTHGPSVRFSTRPVSGSRGQECCGASWSDTALSRRTRVELRAERAVGPEPRDFVLVLVGEQLEVVAGDGVGERFGPGPPPPRAATATRARDSARRRRRSGTRVRSFAPRSTSVPTAASGSDPRASATAARANGAASTAASRPHAKARACSSRPRVRSARWRAPAPRAKPAAGRAAARSRPGTGWCRSRRRAARWRSRWRRGNDSRSSPAAARIACSIASGERSRSGASRNRRSARRGGSRSPWCGPCPCAAAIRRPTSPRCRSRARDRSRPRRCASRGASSGARDAHVARHRAVLLREARDVEHRAALAFEVRRHADQRADRHDAAAADAGDEHVPGRTSRLPRARAVREELVAAGPLALAARPCAARRPTIVTKLGQ